MKDFLVTVEVALGAADSEIALDIVKRIPFGNNNCGFKIVGIREGQLDTSEDLSLLEEIREGQNDDSGFLIIGD